jgi:hypothetical protein
MKESAPPSPEEGAARPAPKPVTDADGFVYLPIPNGVSVARSGSLTRWVGTNCPIEILIGYLNSVLDRPAFDATGLMGRYDFVLTFSTGVPAVEGAGADDGGLTVFGALARQLGLHLDPKKMTTGLFAIDHFVKNPEMWSAAGWTGRVLLRRETLHRYLLIALVAAPLNGGTIRGLIVENASGAGDQPAAGPRMVRADSRGQFEVGSLLPGGYVVKAWR